MAGIRESFPEIDFIENEPLRERVEDVWQHGLDRSDFDDIATVPWWPPLQAQLDGDGADVTSVRHIRDVTRMAIGMADALVDRGVPVDTDTVIAGALVHDVSKLYELSTGTHPTLNDRIPHPHYAVHVLSDAGFGPEILHIAISHSDSSAVAPQTIEASIVHLADKLAVDALFWAYNGTVHS